VLPAATASGSPGENTLLPTTVTELERLGLRPREVALDGGFGHLKSEQQLAPIAAERLLRRPGVVLLLGACNEPRWEVRATWEDHDHKYDRGRSRRPWGPAARIS
jgi:hypothetical protein